MKTALAASLLSLIAIARRSAAPSTPPATAPANIAPGAEPMLRAVISVGEAFRPASGDSALRAFRPEIAPLDSAGECRVTRTRGSGATIVSVSFPSFDSLKMSVTLFFNSAGHLVRYSETRGEALRVRTPSGATEAQRDSAIRASQTRRRSSVTLDYAIDQGLATNGGGGKPTTAVIGTVRQIESLDALGPPTKRLAMVRTLCSV